MKTIYVDNFRGFFNTYIPIKDVNFFVGENSTGKTSILALINLLSCETFWRNQTFNLEEYEFGDFNDIVSNDPNITRIFKIGYIDDSADEKSFASLLVFEEKDGFPIIKYYYHQDLRGVFKVAYNKKPTYFYEPNENEKKFIFLLTNNFNLWLKDCENLHLSFNDSLARKHYTFNKEQSLYYILFFLNDLYSEISKKESKMFIYDIPEIRNIVIWIGPIRSKPRRLYEGYKFTVTPEGDHIPTMIKKTIGSKIAREYLLPSINKFGQKSGLYNEITVNKFGKEKTAPFELRVNVNGNSRRISDVGYGVSQSIPVIVELLMRPRNRWYVIQQPEVHLHPRAQAEFGDVIFEMAQSENKRFFIETHSDFLIDRFRIKLNENQEKQPKSQVIFFEKKNGKNIVTPIDIETSGKYSENQPQSFRDFFIRESIRLLNI